MSSVSEKAPQIAILMTGKIGVRNEEGDVERIVIQRVRRGFGNGRNLNSRYQLQVRRHDATHNDARSGPQLIRRDRFTAAVAAWKAMTDEDRQPWRRAANRKSRTGYNLFISEWMRTNGNPTPPR
jgi:hypothetical protein